MGRLCRPALWAGNDATGSTRDMKTVRIMAIWGALIVAVMVAIRTFAFQSFSIPSASMDPTLLVGDYLYVNKFTYGYSRYSLPFGAPLIAGRVMAAEPRTGDVVVFKAPADGVTDYIKRVVGLPGDRVRMVGGVLHINGEAVRRERIEDRLEGAGTSVRRQAQYVETLPNGRKHRILEISDSGPLDNTPEVQVPPGHYFVMGDNRDNSGDSRVPEVGLVPLVNLVGRADLIFFSGDGTSRLWEIWKWPSSIRFGRMMRTVE